MVFKPLDIYQGRIVEKNRYKFVKFNNGGKGILLLGGGGIPLQQEIEVIVAGYWDVGFPALVLTTDCCNALKIEAELVKCFVVAVSSIGIIAQHNEEYLYFSPHQLAYEHAQLKPGDCINCLVSRFFPDCILQILEKSSKVIVPEFDEDVKEGEPSPLKEFGFDEAVYNKAKKYASLDSRDKLKLGYAYSGLIINNYAKIGNILADIAGDKEIDCQHNVVLRVVNIPPSSKRRIEVEIIG